MNRYGFVYILASQKNGTLYIGSTTDLIARLGQHKTKEISGFTSKYGVDKLVYFESHESLANMVLRERQMKKWNRFWKINLIEKENPNWDCLYNKILAGHGYAPFET